MGEGGSDDVETLRLRQVLKAWGGLAASLALVDLVGIVFTPSGQVAVRAALAAAVSAAAWKADREAARGRSRRALVIAGIGITAAAGLGLALTPVAFPGIAVVPLLVVSLALPHVAGRALHVLLAASAAAAILTIAVGMTLTMPDVGALDAVTAIGAFGATLGTVMIFITQFSARQAQMLARARQALSARDRFLLVAAHELRTPLTPAHLFVQALLNTARAGKELPAAQLVARLERVARTLDRLGDLVDTLLDVSQIEAAGLRVRPERCDLTAIAAEAVSQLRDEAAARGSEVTLHASAPVEGQWDPRRLRQLVTALISNALKFGAGKPVDVFVESVGGKAQLRVKDRGIGIAREDQERIFQRLERAASELEYGGLGFGLWIARVIAEAHGGSVRVESEPSRGSEFTVTLPPARDAHSASRS